MLRRWLPLFLGPILVSLVRCGGSSSETPFPLEPDLAMLDAAGPPQGSEFVVFTGQSAEPEPEPPPERTRQPIPEPEPEPEPLVPLPSPDAGKLQVDAGTRNGDAGARPPARDAGAPRNGGSDAGTVVTKPTPKVSDAGAAPVRDASRD